MNPRPTMSELEAFYRSEAMESSASDGARSSALRVQDPLRYAYFRDNRVLPLLDFLKPESQIYDVGCGVGTFIYAMSREGYTIKGSDVSRASVEAGRELLGLPNKSIETAELDDLPTGNNYDLVTLWTVIEHLLDPLDFLCQIRNKCLTKDGMVLLEFPTTDSIQYQYCREQFFWVMPPYHINLFSIEGMRSLLERAGFDVVYEHLMPRNWYFFESFMRSHNVDSEVLSELSSRYPNLSNAFDTMLDDLSLKLGKPSSRWVLARRTP